MLDQSGSDFRKPVKTHIENESSGEPGEFVVVESRFGFVGMFVPGDEGDAGGDFTVRQRDAGISCGGNGGGDTGNDFEGDARRAEGSGFFGSASKNEGIASLESDDAFPFFRGGNEPLVDLCLIEEAGAVASRTDGSFGFGGGMVEEVGIDQTVIEDKIGGFEEFESTEGEESRVAGSGSDEIDFPGPNRLGGIEAGRRGIGGG